MAGKKPRVSVIIATLNEEAFIERALRSVFEGTLPPDEVEAVVADGGSCDRTREVVLNLAQTYPNIRLVENPRRIAPCGFNAAIKATRADVIALLSAHCYVDPNYLEVCLRALEETGADVSSGVEVALPPDDSLQARLATAVLGSRFGVGLSFRTAHKEGPVDAVCFPVYRRTAFERVSLYDERLVRNQDNELTGRVRASGGVVWLTPKTRGYYYGRGTIAGLMKQNYRNGLYAVLNWRITPASFSVRHMIPFLFVLFLLAGAALSFVHPWLVLGYAAVLGLYVLLDVASAIQLVVRHRRAAMLLTIPIFPLLHIAYGVGTLVSFFRFGLTRIPDQKPEKLAPRPAEE